MLFDFQVEKCFRILFLFFFFWNFCFKDKFIYELFMRYADFVYTVLCDLLISNLYLLKNIGVYKLREQGVTTRMNDVVCICTNMYYNFHD